MSDDAIQEAIVDRANELGLSAYAVGKRCEITPEAVKRFFAGRAALNSRYVSRICQELGLELRVKKDWKLKTPTKT